jgi:hypothetical protein
MSINLQVENLPIRIICATRASRDSFLSSTATGKSIRSFINASKVEVRLFAENKIGLSKVYNIAIRESKNNPAILVFMHDDIWISDFFWAERIRSNITRFDVLGLAGNKRRLPFQPGWFFINDKFEADFSTNLSGVVGHGQSFTSFSVQYYGLPEQPCLLLDGLFLAAKSETLLSNNIFFDERFTFHFYDLDFCRTLENAKLTMGTFSLSVIHQSGGSFNSLAWQQAFDLYLKKWQN